MSLLQPERYPTRPDGTPWRFRTLSIGHMQMLRRLQEKLWRPIMFRSISLGQIYFVHKNTQKTLVIYGSEESNFGVSGHTRKDFENYEDIGLTSLASQPSSINEKLDSMYVRV